MKIRLPTIVNVAILILATTLFYTYVGQLVPQAEIYPPEEVLIQDDATTDQDDGAMTDEGEADTSTSTTTGG